MKSKSVLSNGLCLPLSCSETAVRAGYSWYFAVFRCNACICQCTLCYFRLECCIFSNSYRKVLMQTQKLENMANSFAICRAKFHLHECTLCIHPEQSFCHLHIQQSYSIRVFYCNVQQLDTNLIQYYNSFCSNGFVSHLHCHVIHESLI